MARNLFQLEKGVHIVGENSSAGIMILFGSAAPGGSGDPDSAEQGSVYFRTNGAKYTKTTSGTGTDKWKLDDITNVETALGLSDGDSTFGSFTGSILSSSSDASALLQELEVDLEALQTAIGIAAEAAHMGTYTGSLLNDNETAKQNLQQIETAIEGIVVNTSNAAVTTITAVDSISVDTYKGAIWDVVVSLDSDPARVQMFTIAGVHNGVIAPGTPADADDVDDTLYSKLRIGTAFVITVGVALNGLTGAAQEMDLNVTSAAAVTVSARRRVILP